MTAPDPDDLRSVNQQRIDALRDQMTARSEDHHELAHDREETAEEDYHRDDDEKLDEDTDFHSGLGY